MKTLLEIVNEYTTEELEVVDYQVGDRGMINIDVEILLNVWDRAFTDWAFTDLDDVALESTCWMNLQKSINW